MICNPPAGTCGAWDGFGRKTSVYVFLPFLYIREPGRRWLQHWRKSPRPRAARRNWQGEQGEAMIGLESDKNGYWRDCILRHHLGVVRTLSWLSGLLPGWKERDREKIMSTQPDSSAPSSRDGSKVRIKEIDCNSCKQQQKPHCQRGGEYSERVCLPEGHMPHVSSGCRGGKLGKTIARFFLF